MRVYSCHSTDRLDRRVKSESALVQSGWRYEHDAETGTTLRIPVMVRVTTDWVRKSCGVEPQAGWSDQNCRGCVHDGAATTQKGE